MKSIMQQQVDSLCSNLIRDYIGSDEVPERIVIDKFITEYLGYVITYASFASKDKLAFISDGKNPIVVYQNGKKVRRLFPSGTIVIDEFLKDERNESRRRFVLAHEAGHIIDGAVEGKLVSAFFSDSSDAYKDCSLDELKSCLSLEEAKANRYAAALLMPDFVVGDLIEKYHRGYKFNVYDDVQLMPCDRKAFKIIAEKLDVSFTALFYRLKALDGLVFQPNGKYIQKLNFGGKRSE